MQNEHAHYVTEKLLPALADEHIVLLSWDRLTTTEQERLPRYYRQQVFPVLTRRSPSTPRTRSPTFPATR